MLEGPRSTRSPSSGESRTRGSRGPPGRRATALLHDPLEPCPTARRQLRGNRLTHTELKALELLTHAPASPTSAGDAAMLADLIRPRVAPAMRTKQSGVRTDPGAQQLALSIMPTETGASHLTELLIGTRR